MSQPALAAAAQRGAGAVPAPSHERGRTPALLFVLGVVVLAGAVGLLAAAAAALGRRAAPLVRTRQGGGSPGLS